LLYVDAYRLLEDEIKEKEMLLNQGELEIQSVRAKEKTKRQLEREKVKRELERQKQMEAQLQQQKERFMVLRDLIDAGAGAKTSSSSGSDSSEPPRTPSVGQSARFRCSDSKVVNTPSLRVSLSTLVSSSLIRISLN